jgi:hypothetical protein
MLADATAPAPLHRILEGLIMSFQMASLLLHSESVPASARHAILAAQQGETGDPREHLESAARILHVELGMACADARELVDLPVGRCL